MVRVPACSAAVLVWVCHVCGPVLATDGRDAHPALGWADAHPTDGRDTHPTEGGRDADPKPGGEIFGRVSSCATGLPIPETTVVITSPRLLGARRFVTGPSGRFAFAGIVPAVYLVRYAAAGFAAASRAGVEVEAGLHVAADVCLSPAGPRLPGEASAPRGDDPPIDARTPTVAFNVTKAWLQQLPFAREEPAALRLPATAAAARAADEGTAQGIIEDLRVEPATVDVSEDNGDARAVAVRATGSDRFAGSARFHLADRRLQWDNLTPALAARGADDGRRLERLTEIAVEAGGPLRRGRTWAWGDFSRTSADAGFVGTCRDLTVISKTGATLQHQWQRGHKTSLLWSRLSRYRPHYGASAYDQPEATSRQHSLGLARPLQAEHQWLARDALVVTAGYTLSDDSYALDFQEPRLAAVQPAYDRFTLARWRSGTERRHSGRSQSVNAGASWFLPTSGAGDHTVTFGIEVVSSQSSDHDRTGGGAEAVFDSRTGTRLPWQARLFRDGLTRHAASHVSAFAQDSLRLGRVTLQAGVRFERQDDRALDAFIPENLLLPALLPAVRFAGADSGVVYGDLCPRLGLAWDPAGNGRTLIKLAMARHVASGNSTSTVLQPTTQTRLVYWWNDADADGWVQAGELDVGRGFAATPSSNYDPAHPGAVKTPASVDPGLENIATDTFSAGIERQLGRRVTLRASYTGRRASRFQSSFPVEADGSPVESASFYPVDWRPTACPPAARCPTVTYYQRDAPLPAGTILRNDGEYAWRHSLGLVLHKRFSAGWMADAAFNWNGARSYFLRPTRDYTDPTNVAARNATEYGADVPHWAMSLSGSVRLPWRLGAAAILTSRQGLPFDRVVSSPNRNALGSTNVLVARYGSERYPSVTRLDARLDWRLATRAVTLVPSLNVFNALNSNAVLARNRVQNSRTANDVTEIAPPRSLRVEVLLAW